MSYGPMRRTQRASSAVTRPASRVDGASEYSQSSSPPVSGRSQPSRWRWPDGSRNPPGSVNAAVSVNDEATGSASGLDRLADRRVALPALVLQLDDLDRDRVGGRVELGQRLVLRHPAPEQLVRVDLLA